MHAAEGYLRPQGVPHSNRLKVVEKRTMLDDGNAKRLETILDDPSIFPGSPGVSLHSGSVPDFEIMDYDCVCQAPYIEIEDE